MKIRNLLGVLAVWMMAWASGAAGCGNGAAHAGPGGSGTGANGTGASGGTSSGGGCCVVPVSVTVPCVKYTSGIFTGSFALNPYPGLSTLEIGQRVTAFAIFDMFGTVLTNPGGHPLAGGGSQVPVEVTSDGYAAVDCQLVSSDRHYSAATFSLH